MAVSDDDLVDLMDWIKARDDNTAGCVNATFGVPTRPNPK